MTIQEIIEKIQKEIEKQKTISEQENKELEIFNNFFDNNKTNNFDGIRSLNICDFITVYLKSNNINLPIEEIKDKIIFDEEFLEYSPDEEFENLMILFNYVVQENILQEIITITNESNNIKRKKLINDLIEKQKTEEDDDEEIIKDVLMLIEENNKILEHIKCYNDNKDVFNTLIGLVLAIKTTNGKYADIHNSLYLLFDEENNNMPSRNKEKIINKSIKHIIKMDAFDKEMVKIREYHSKIISEDKQLKRNSNKVISAYQNLINGLLQGIKKDEITNYEQMLSKIPNENIRKEVLKLIHWHNLEYYNKLDDKYKNLSANSVVRYQALLQEYGIQKHEYYIELIMKNSIEDTTFILKKLTKMNIQEKGDIIQILQTSNKNIVEYIFSLKEKGILNQIFITNNINIFSEEKEEYKNLVSNLKHLTNNKINPQYFIDSQEILILSPEKLLTNINVLKEYDLTTGMNKNINYDFIKNTNLEILIDTILELGYESLLEKNINLLNYDETKWKRIRVLKEMNMPVIGKEELEKTLESNFFIPDEKLDDYILNVVPYNLSIKINSLTATEKNNDNMLKDFSVSKRLYKIGNVLLSKERVNRNLEKLQSIEMNDMERMLVSTITGATLNDEELERIKKEIAPKLTR